jgi:hypothetical protein
LVFLKTGILKVLLEAERWRSAAAGSGSDVGAYAGGSRLPGKGTGYPAPSPQIRT